MDEIDEEESHKLDEALAEAFRNTKKARGKNVKQNKDDKTLTHFRVRVLDLIEIYLDSEPSMLLCLEIAIMLLQILEFSIRDVHQKPLEQRVRSCLKKLSSLKKFSSTDGVTEDVLLEMLNSFLDKGSKSAFIYQDMEDKISECCLFIIRCSLLLPKEENLSPKKLKKKLLHSPLVETIKNSLEAFFIKRDCPLPVVLFKDILKSVWEGNWALIPILVDIPFNNEIRPFRRSQALELLRLFYMNNRFRLSNVETFNKKILPLETKLSADTINFLRTLSENPKECKVKEKFICNLFNLLHAVKNIGGNENCDWVTIGNLIREYRSHVSLSKDAKTAYNKLCRILGIPSLVKMQLITNGHNESEEETQSETKSQNSDKKIDKKRKKNKSLKKDKQKLKKEAKLLREKAASEGLEQNINFNNMLLTNLNTDELTEGDEVHTKNKFSDSIELEENVKSSKKRHNNVHSNEIPTKKKKRNSKELD